MKLLRLVLGPSEPGQIVWKQRRNESRCHRSERMSTLLMIDSEQGKALPNRRPGYQGME